jgi:hypothetical protein
MKSAMGVDATLRAHDKRDDPDRSALSNQQRQKAES